jgi:hypothetical protein
MSRTEIQACESGAPVRPNFEVPNFEVRDIPRLLEGEPEDAVGAGPSVDAGARVSKAQ